MVSAPTDNENICSSRLSLSFIDRNKLRALTFTTVTTRSPCICTRAKDGTVDPVMRGECYKLLTVV